MADKPDVTQEAAELNAAEDALKAVVMRPDERQQIILRHIHSVDEQMKDISVQYAVSKDSNKTKLLEATRDLLKYKDAMKKQLEGTQ